MCMACEMAFWNMLDALPPEAQERILRERARDLGLACDAPDDDPAVPQNVPQVGASRE